MSDFVGIDRRRHAEPEFTLEPEPGIERGARRTPRTKRRPTSTTRTSRTTITARPGSARSRSIGTKWRPSARKSRPSRRRPTRSSAARRRPRSNASWRCDWSRPAGTGAARDCAPRSRRKDLQFGPYSIFHREREDGKSLLYVASMMEPGSFDLARMDEQEFSGISLFGVVPGTARCAVDVRSRPVRRARTRRPLEGPAPGRAGQHVDVAAHPQPARRAGPLRASQPAPAAELMKAGAGKRAAARRPAAGRDRPAQPPLSRPRRSRRSRTPQYDRLLVELRALEEEHPALVVPDSPTQRVGGAPVAAFAQVRHRMPMLSLDNAFSREDVVAFDRRVRERLETEREIAYACEPKLDGLAVSLTYRKGSLEIAATRGDGSRRRGRHAQHPHDPDAFRCGSSGKAPSGRAGGARRSVHVDRRIQGDEPHRGGEGREGHS